MPKNKKKKKVDPYSPGQENIKGQKKGKKKHRFHWEVLIPILLILFVLLPVCAVRWFNNATGMTLKECREYAEGTIADTDTSVFRLNQRSYVYDCNGEEMAVLSTGDASTYLSYDEIPEGVINAFIAVEDRTFWENKGYDTKAILRAAASYVTSGKVSQGGSTITQQLCKLTYLSSEKTVGRKAKEIFLAAELTDTYSKEQIMEWYVNNVCFANGIYGIEDAAEAYFGKTASELSLAECAYLCAIPNRPEYYDPWDEPENAVERQEKILGDMLDCGLITQAEYDEAMVEQLKVTSGKTEDEYDYAISYAVKCAVEILMGEAGFEFTNEFNSDRAYQAYLEEYESAYTDAKNELYTGGYKVYTSIDPESQEALQGILDEGLSFNTDTADNGIYNVQGSLTAIDNETGKVVAIVGGRTQEGTDAVYGYNRAYQYTRQPGSSVKPLIAYLPALESGYTANSKLKDVSVQKAYAAYEDGKDVQALSGTQYSLRYSVEHSLNGAALYVYSEVTPEVGMGYLLSMGFSNIVPNDYYLSAVLGGFTYGTNTLEMANAYSTIANYGEYRDADCITSMVDAQGAELSSASEAVEIYDADACAEMTDILEGVLTTGTASGISWSDYTDEPAAGKTGTTNEEADGWFAGYTNDYTIAVWVGSDDKTSVSNLTGGTYPAQIWRDAMLWLTENKATGRGDSIFDAWEEEAEEEASGYEIWHTNQAAYVRSGPGRKYGIVYTLQANTDVILVERGTYWSEIIVDGTDCYIYSPFLSKGSVETH